MTQVLRTFRRDASRTPVQADAWSGRIGRSDGPRRVLQAGEHLFQAGDVGDEAFILRTGRLKSYRVYRDGEEQILGMHGPGDALGFEALIGKPASCSVVALEIASIEVVDLTRTPVDPDSRSASMRYLVEGMHTELQRYCRLLHMDRHPADRRLAEFLLGFSDEERERSRSAVELTLPLNRRDLARFLGLAPETLSRIFSRFQEQGIMSVHNRRIRILDLDALTELAGD